AAGRGRDGPPPDDAARAELRQQALDGLRAERDAYAQLLDAGPPPTRAAVGHTLRHWRADPDLAGVRDADAVAALPGAERVRWRALWAGVEALAERAEAASP